MNIKLFVTKLIPKNTFPLVRSFYYKINRFVYSGMGVHCPICEKNYKKFLPGTANKLNSRCPGCGTAERHRLLWLYLKDKLNILSANFNLLDIAPDQAIQNKLKSLQNINYLSVDLESSFAMKQMDLTNLEFKDKTFDAVICYHVLEHILDDRKAIKEIYRVLKPDGWAIIQSPIDFTCDITFEDPSVISPEKRLKVFGQEDHVRIYGMDYIDRLKEPGFNVIEDKFVQDFDNEKIKLYGLDEDEIVYFCRKK